MILQNTVARRGRTPIKKENLMAEKSRPEGGTRLSRTPFLRCGRRSPHAVEHEAARENTFFFSYPIR